MKRLVPSIGTPVSMIDILSALFSRKGFSDFEERLKDYMGRKYLLFTNSGTTAYFIILRALREFSDKTEVILPAYTAPSLVLPVKKAGLTPRLCDMDLKSFNMDLARIKDTAGEKTLAATMIHMFGIPSWFSPSLNREEEVDSDFIIEDLASALGSVLFGRPVGSFGDVGFVSFNRGKNLSTTAGGAVLTDRKDIYEALLKVGKGVLKRPDVKTRANIFLKTGALSLAVRPWFYSLLSGFISQFKYTETHYDFDSYAYTPFQAGLGASLFKDAHGIFECRYRNGIYLHRELSGLGGVLLPDIPKDSKPVFNQFPLLIDDVSKRDDVLKTLVHEGIEATTLYPEPVHRVHKIGYEVAKEPFPNAEYMSKRLLLIPTHPYMEEKDLKKAVDVIKNTLGQTDM